MLRKLDIPGINNGYSEEDSRRGTGILPCLRDQRYSGPFAISFLGKGPAGKRYEKTSEVF